MSETTQRPIKSLIKKLVTDTPSHDRLNVHTPITVAVAGNPNAGKSTLINTLAGTRLQVGNWPGVTVEKVEALLTYKGRQIRLVDLPGTYSLNPYTQEEIIARDYLIHSKPDIILNVVDATNLERNLALTVQLTELEIPIVVALNIYDEAQKKGYTFDVATMEELLDLQVLPTVARKRGGLDTLLDVMVATVDNSAGHLPRRLVYGEDIEAAAVRMQDRIREAFPDLQDKYPLKWLAYRLMEGDERVLKELKVENPDKLTGDIVHHLKEAHGNDMAALMAEARYAQAAGFTREVLKKPSVLKRDMTERIDAIVLNKFLGLPIFLVSIWFVFKLTFDVSTPFSSWIDGFVSGVAIPWAGVLMALANAPGWLSQLVTEGIVAGVGFVLVFVPMIFAMMFFITLLEGSGYIARAAFVMDRVMHAIGLHGKSFIPMLLGFGCNVPAIYATRILENKKDKILTALMVPLMSCSARLPVYALFAAVFFPAHTGTVLWSLYVLGVVLAVVMGFFLRKTLFSKESPMFIMELPPYRIPPLKSLMIHTWVKGKHFLVKAGTYIFAMSILVWFVLHMPWGVENKKDSLLGQASQIAAPVFKPLGFGHWEAVASLLTGVIAKEIVITTMGEIYVPKAKEKTEGGTPVFMDDIKGAAISFLEAFKKAGENVFSTFGISSIAEKTEVKQKTLKSAVAGTFTPLSAYAFLVFVLLYMPCLVTAVAFKQEFGSWLWFFVAVSYELPLAWLAAFTVYQVGSIFS